MDKIKTTLIGFLKFKIFEIIKLLKGLTILLVLVILTFSCGSSFKDSNKLNEIINNYKIHQREIREMESFFLSKVSMGGEISILFNSNDEVLHLISSTNIKEKDGGFNNIISSEYNILVESPRMDSILKSIGLAKGTMVNLMSYLEKINCIGISNLDKRLKIYCQYEGVGLYSYIIYEEGSNKNEFVDSILYSDTNMSIIYETPF